MRLCILLVATCVLACDPTYGVHGTVRDASGAPISGANVQKTCPSGHNQSMSTGADGAFSFGGVGGAFEASKCMLVVEAPGYAARTMHTYDVCYTNSEDGAHSAYPCPAGKGDVTLTK